jgi:hypothetical protein
MMVILVKMVRLVRLETTALLVTKEQKENQV